MYSRISIWCTGDLMLLLATTLDLVDGSEVVVTSVGRTAMPQMARLQFVQAGQGQGSQRGVAKASLGHRTVWHH